MPASTASQDLTVMDLLLEAKNILEDATSGARIPTTLDQSRLLEQKAFEVLRLVRSRANKLAPSNRLPPEILCLIPSFWDTWERDRDVIALTHVCQTWRQVFTSCSTLWTNFHCVDAEKTEVYFKRSKESPIILRLTSCSDTSSSGPLCRTILNATSRLESLDFGGWVGWSEQTIAHFSAPAPLLRHLSMGVPQFPPTFLGGNPSSLRTLKLCSFPDTGLPWRNMVNLTSFTLDKPPPGESPMKQLLDFLESAPHLREVHIPSIAPTPGAPTPNPQDDRLVSLRHLQELWICGGGPCSLLLNHLLIPIGAKLIMNIHALDSRPEIHFPRNLSNLQNLDFREVHLATSRSRTKMVFTGPNGQVSMVVRCPAWPQPAFQPSLSQYLVQMVTSETELLEMCLPSGTMVEDSPSGVLLQMENLQTLDVCGSSPTLVTMVIQALDPGSNRSGVITCPRLRKVILDQGDPHVQAMEELARKRALAGVELDVVAITHKVSSDEGHGWGGGWGW